MRGKTFGTRTATAFAMTMASIGVPAMAQSVDFAENNAADWTSFAPVDLAPTSVSRSTVRVIDGSSSILFTTESGFDTGVKYPVGGHFNFDATPFDYLAFWEWPENTTPIGWQGVQPIVVLRTGTGTITLTPTSQRTSNFTWRRHRVPLLGGDGWVRSDAGSPTLADIDQIEIHHDTWDYGFRIYFDGVRFEASVPCAADLDDGSGLGIPDGGVTIDDLLFFTDVFEAGLLQADLDDGTGTGVSDGGVTIDDLLFFLSAFEAGCSPLIQAPSDLRIDNLWPTQADLRWNDNSDNETSFRLAMSAVGSGGPFNNVCVEPANDTGCRISNLAPGTCYWFKVRAANAAGYSDYSPVLQVCTPVGTPNAPANLRVANLWTDQVDLNWDDVSNDEDQFLLGQSDGGPNGPWTTACVEPANDTGCRVAGLVPNRCYWFRVQACNVYGCSTPTPSLLVCTPDAVPLPPSDLRLENLWPTQADLRWTDNSNNETTFRLAMSSTGVNGSYSNVCEEPANDTGCRVLSLSPGSCYWFKVRATNAAGASEYSMPLQVCTPTGIPNMPGNLRVANLWPDQVDINWDDLSADEDEFRLAMSDVGPTGPWGNVCSEPANDPGCRVSGLSPNRCYWFQVRACNTYGCSEFTPSLQVCTPDVVPAAPSDVRTDNIFVNAIDLRWTDNSNNETGFEAQRSSAGANGPWSAACSTPANDTGCRSSGLASNTQYWFRVRACNAVGCSAWVVGGPFRTR